MDLLSSCGLAGIGIYWIIIEILHQQETGTITADQLKKYIKFYTSFQTSGEHLLNKIEQELISSKLLIEKDGIVYSERVLQNKKIREEISQKRSFAGLKSAESKGFKTLVKQDQTSVEQNSTKERKEKESKVNESDKGISRSLVFDYDKLLIEFSNSHEWQEDVCRALKMQWHDVNTQLQVFLSEQKAKDNLQRSLQDIKAHFVDWLKKQKNGKLNPNINPKVVTGF